MDDLVQPPGGPNPNAPITEYERQATVDRIQQALAHGLIDFSEVDDRFELVFGAQTRAELEAAVGDLPPQAQPPPPQDSRHLAPANSFSLIGTVKIGGWLSVGGSISASTLIGEVVIDVSSAAIPEQGLDISANCGIGDIKIIVPDGARVQASVVTLVGDRKEVLAPPVSGGPIIRVKAFSVVGDAKVYSLSEVPEGALRRAWAALRRAVDG